MFLSLALLLPDALPTFGDNLENLFFLGIGFLIIIFALFACGALLQGLSRAFETSADWLSHYAAKRRRSRKRGVLRKYYPPLRVVQSRSEHYDSSLLAHDALRRSAEAAHQTEQLPTRPKTNLRIVKRRERM